MDFRELEIARIRDRLDKLEHWIRCKHKPKAVRLYLRSGYLFIEDDHGNSYQLLAGQVPEDLELPACR